MTTNNHKTVSMKHDDLIRHDILMHLYERHKSARGLSSLSCKISELQRAMKAHGIKQKECNSNLDYLIQKGWVVKEVTPRTFFTPGGVQQTSDQVSYKISDIGIDRVEKDSMFKRELNTSGINISNVSGVVIVGDDNVVNHDAHQLSDLISQLEARIRLSHELNDTQLLNVTSDIGSIQNQLSKTDPNWEVVQSLWSGVEAIVTGADFVDLTTKISSMLT
jgi:hypothetical protein